MCHHCNVGEGERKWKSELFTDNGSHYKLQLFQVKCHNYWPNTGTMTFEQYEVVAHSCNKYAEYTLREFNLVDIKVMLSPYKDV